MPAQIFASHLKVRGFFFLADYFVKSLDRAAILSVFTFVMENILLKPLCIKAF